MSRRTLSFLCLLSLMTITHGRVVPVYPDTHSAAGALVPAASYLGTHYLERVSYELSGGGDVNGDGFCDFVTGNYHSDFGDEANWKNTGSVYLILGKSTGWQSNVGMNASDAHFVGKNKYDAAGYSVAVTGDVNGDGLDDILSGACAGDKMPDNPGHAYVVFGRKSANWGHHFVLADSANASFNGESAMSLAGYAVDFIGDLNKDGCDEFLIGAPNHSGLRGRVYLFKGKPAGWSRGISLAAADAIFSGSSNAQLAGTAVAGLGDANGDGISDFAISEVGGTGRVFLIFGKTAVDWGTNFDLNRADVILSGEETGSYAGWKVSAAGDVNADGLADFLITAPYFNNDRGRIYLIFGKKTGWVSTALSNADVIYSGEKEWDEAGWSVKGGGDLDGDGCSEFMIGADAADQSTGDDNSGKAYLIKGHRGAWTKNVSLGSVQDYFFGEHLNDNAGYAVGPVGDVNGDGSCDFATTAPRYDLDASRLDYGKMYLFLGDRLTWKVKGQILCANLAPVPNVSMKMNGDSVACASTKQGLYSVSVKVGKNCTLTPFKTRSEDIGDTVITAYDAALTARHAVGLESLDSDPEKKAADANGDGQILINDAVEIVRYSVGLPGVGVQWAGDWVFEPSSRTHSNVQQDQPSQNFQAVVRGDVDGNWHPALVKRSGMSVWWDAVGNVRADTLTIAFYARADFPIVSADLVLGFDENAYRFLSTVQTAPGKRLKLFSSANAGTLRIGGFTADPVEGAELLQVNWRIMNGNAGQHNVQLKRLHINDQKAALNHALSSVELPSKTPLGVSLFQNYPNPFNRSTVFELALPGEKKIRISVCNQNGQTVDVLWNDRLSAGKHVFRWGGKTAAGAELPTGIYLVRVTGVGIHRSFKMLLLK